jgi:two-component system, LytTR family, response regulator
MTCVILEDDLMAKALLEQMIQETDSLELLKSFTDSKECFKFLSTNTVDLLFLDIEMPGMSGLEMLENLPVQPHIIFTTGNEEYAIKSFDYKVVDFLVKPFSYVRFLKAVLKAGEIGKLSVPETGKPDPDFLFIKQSGQFLKLPFYSILYLEALGDYINVFTREKKYTIHETLKHFQAKLPPHFIRVHRSFVVNTDFITSVEDTSIYLQNQNIPIGVSYKGNVYKSLRLA